MSVELKNITVQLGEQKVFNDLSLQVRPNEILALFGGSGSGKSSLLRLITGFIESEHGDVLINGQDTEGLEPEKRDIGMAFQNFSLFPHMSAFENIATPLTARRKNHNEIKKTVEAIAVILKIDHVLTHFPGALSNGQKQRVSLARAIVAKPSLLLLDDPLRNVDAKLRFEMRLELRRILATPKGVTVIYVTQDYREAMALGDRIAVLGDGRILQIGTPEDIYLTPATVDIARSFGDPVINLWEVQPQRDKSGVFITLAQERLTIGHGFMDQVGKKCLLGVRPESIRYATAESKRSVLLLIKTQMPLNEKNIILAQDPHGQEILISEPVGQAVTHQRKIYLDLDFKSMMLFDQSSGRRLTNKLEKTKWVGTDRS